MPNRMPGPTRTTTDGNRPDPPRRRDTPRRCTRTESAQGSRRCRNRFRVPPPRRNDRQARTTRPRSTPASEARTPTASHTTRERCKRPERCERCARCERLATDVPDSRCRGRAASPRSLVGRWRAAASDRQAWFDLTVGGIVAFRGPVIGGRLRRRTPARSTPHPHRVAVGVSHLDQLFRRRRGNTRDLRVG